MLWHNTWQVRRWAGAWARMWRWWWDTGTLQKCDPLIICTDPSEIRYYHQRDLHIIADDIPLDQAIYWINCENGISDPVRVCASTAMATFDYRPLTHWGRVTHICVGNLTIIGSDNGLAPGRRQAIIWTNAGLLSIGPLRTYFNENLFKMQ